MIGVINECSNKIPTKIRQNMDTDLKITRNVLQCFTALGHFAIKINKIWYFSSPHLKFRKDVQKKYRHRHLYDLHLKQ